MSYRYAIGSYGRPVSPPRRRLAFAVCALVGSGAALVGALALGWEIVPPWVAAVLFAAAIACGTLSAAQGRPAGEIFFPRSDGTWADLDGSRVVDARHLAGGPPIGAFEAACTGGFAAASVCGKRRSGRFSAGTELHDVTVLVTAPGRRAYRTRILLHLLPGDDDRLWPGTVLPAARFSDVAPDIAILPDDLGDLLTAEERERLDAVCRAAPSLREAVHAPLRDTQTYRRITRGHNEFWTFFYERPHAVWQDVRARGDGLRYVQMTGVALGAFLGTSALVLLAIALRLVVPWLDGGVAG
ncbi:hypothetical protein [Microbacterium sp. No. 7]|uniref:hypothetical protein n=1 Tax=Microbacterium sp. No. 7 TaxID=1714373 RepID=UPI0006CF4340|nr:hypothetical protein [Microbacterium sp. No. 7]ALJ20089.1 hypothetical protein AOA12_09270 [Microbacterium sp. No. 7]